MFYLLLNNSNKENNLIIKNPLSKSIEKRDGMMEWKTGNLFRVMFSIDFLKEKAGAWKVSTSPSFEQKNENV